MKHRHLVVRLLHIWVPYIQLTGYVILLGGSSFVAYQTMAMASDYGVRISANEQAIQKLMGMDEKLDLAITLLRRR